jgi:hypothetical protein
MSINNYYYATYLFFYITRAARSSASSLEAGTSDGPSLLGAEVAGAASTSEDS